MSALLCIGEGMLELRKAGEHHIPYGYAGDTLNAAIYAKRVHPEVQVGYLTGIGSDPYSQGFVDYCQHESIEVDLLLSSETANLGIYSIATDEAGERSFYYWRKGSAATQFVELFKEFQKHNRIDTPEMVFFSGLTLGILSDESKSGFLDMLREYKELGSQIAFDPNYRPKMWQDKQHAIEWLDKAYAISDIILPGLDEHTELYGHTTPNQVLDYIAQFGFEELVIKCGDDGVVTFDVEHKKAHIPFNPAPKQVDSTAAGDSF
ncbi:sugar kinase, partial [Paraglaciecola sp.]|uniref:sugar kinase n=1 Tax=Paraglaciecola sp. TaxID=1920173 RepID=UPI003EF0E2FF